MKNRLEEFMKLEGLTSVKFAEIMQIQPSSVSHILSGRNNPNFDFVSRMLQRFPDLNPDWFINGMGEVYRSKQGTVATEVTDVIATERDIYKSSNNKNQPNNANTGSKNSSESIGIHAFTNVNAHPLHQVKPNNDSNASELVIENYRTPHIPYQNTDNELYNPKQDNSTASDVEVSKRVSEDAGILAKHISTESDTGIKEGEKRIIKIVFFYSDSTSRVFDVE